MSTNIGFIVGSLRQDSNNLRTAQAFEKLLPENVEATFIEIGDLPFYNEDLEVTGKVPESWMRFRKEIAKMDGFFFFTPEYNRSIPAALKNALDVGSRPYGESNWDSKPAAVISVAPRGIAGFGANHALRQSLVFLNMPVLQQPEAYIGNFDSLLNEDGTFVEDTKNFFQIIIDKYLDFFNKLTK
ncbi:NADPH-dependent FMN reductase [Tetragenococcus muriaticus]|uniref:NADPH-dependent FMN reductase n=1 Tax=Tetragenococcus muriaticus TaxID=64642 RepID=UPI00041CB06E|nr:NAD(P)H-dependent oxidoreductase [Tetragenococcus muriaticus]GMA47565.1 flavin reductase [Tetragenococcus muriaticus]